MVIMIRDRSANDPFREPNWRTVAAAFDVLGSSPERGWHEICVYGAGAMVVNLGVELAPWQ